MKKILDFFYSWLYPSHAMFFNGLQEEQQARGNKFWNSLVPCEWALLGTFLFIGILAAVLYFKPFNNKPGRHYLGRWWWLFAAISAAVTFIASAIIGCSMIKDSPNLSNSILFKWWIAFANTGYALLTYFIVSFIWWNWGHTNAYRFCYIGFLHKK